MERGRLRDGQMGLRAAQEILARSSNFYDVERSEWGVRCLIGQSFEPPVIKVVEDFMHRNIARSLALWRIGEIEEAKEDIRERHGRRIVYGQSNARWLAIVDYFATVHGNPHCQKLNGLLQAVASCGAIWLAAEKAVYCNRPKVARFDEQGRFTMTMMLRSDTVTAGDFTSCMGWACPNSSW